MDKVRVMDKSALLKTMAVMLISIVWVTTYGGNMAVCSNWSKNDVTGSGIFNDIESSKCRMTLYGGDLAEGPVKALYYLIIWVGIFGLSVLGFAILCCNCSKILVRVYAFGLVGGAACVGIAEVITIGKNYGYYKDNKPDDLWMSYSAEHNGHNIVVFLMETYILLNTAWDAWVVEHKEVPAESQNAGNMAV